MSATLTAPPPQPQTPPAQATPPAASITPPPVVPPKVKPRFHPFTGEQYDRMVEVGILGTKTRVELIEGMVVEKMPADPIHDFPIKVLIRRFPVLIPTGWVLSVQMGVRLAGSRPEPDLALARGTERDYIPRHPSPADLGLVVEVANSSIDFDQEDKARIYARDSIPVYWIVNLPDRRVEVYTDPTGPGDAPRYATARTFGPGTAVPVELDGQAVATIPVDELLP